MLFGDEITEEAAILQHSFKADIVATVCEKVAEDKRKSLKDIALELTALVMGGGGGADAVGGGGMSGMSSVLPVAVTNTISYDEYGNAEGVGRATVNNNGFCLGSVVAQTIRGSSKVTQWEILDIMHDGSVELGPIMAAGSVDAANKFQVELDAFLGAYKECKQIEYLSTYPKCEGHNSDHFIELGWKSIVIMSLRTLALKFDPPFARIMSAPCKGVYAKAKFAVGEYTVVPVTTHVTFEKNPFGIPRKQRVRINAKLAPHIILTSEGPNEQFAVQYWSIREDDDASKCNCAIVVKDVKMKRPTLNEKTTTI